jgi:hypothetical protein
MDWTRHATSSFVGGLNIEIPKMGIFPQPTYSVHILTGSGGGMQVEKAFSRLDYFSNRAVCLPPYDANPTFVLCHGDEYCFEGL